MKVLLEEVAMKMPLVVFMLFLWSFSCGDSFSNLSSDVLNQGDSFAQGDIKPQKIEQAKSNLEKEKNPKVAEGDLKTLSKDNAEFAFEIYQRLSEEEENLFISPLSISIALAQTYAGAKGATKDEIGKALHFSLLDETLHKAMNSLEQTLESRADVKVEKGEPFKLSIVNALWGQRDYPFVQAYLDLLALNYGAGINLLDFIADPEAARYTINQWVEEQTYHKIKELLGQGTVTTDTRLVLTNAIYFKAGWQNKFNAKSTSPHQFTCLDGSKIQVNMMHMEVSDRFPYIKSENYEAVILPYVGNMVGFMIVMPNEGKFKDVEKSLDGTAFIKMMESMKQREGWVSLPKFQMEYKKSLVSSLKALGMEKAFTPMADFTGISEKGDLMISDIIHQTFLKVDEEGTEAAGATAVIFVDTGLPSEPPFEMIVDRSFIFAIVDMPTNAVMFLGRVIAL